jgi:hypothetical protein
MKFEEIEKIEKEFFSKNDPKLEKIINSINIEGKNSPYYKDKFKYEEIYRRLKAKIK